MRTVQVESRSDSGLLTAVASFGTQSTSQTVGDCAVRNDLCVRPENLEPFGDVAHMAQRVEALLRASSVPVAQEAAPKQFVRKWQARNAQIDGVEDDAGYDDDMMRLQLH